MLADRSMKTKLVKEDNIAGSDGVRTKNIASRDISPT